MIVLRQNPQNGVQLWLSHNMCHCGRRAPKTSVARRREEQCAPAKARATHDPAQSRRVCCVGACGACPSRK